MPPPLAGYSGRSERLNVSVFIVGVNEIIAVSQIDTLNEYYRSFMHLYLRFKSIIYKLHLIYP